jgi:hypothetical protein
LITERATFTKAEREYVKGIVRNLSLQRYTDREIAQWLYDEKQIPIDRSTISKIRRQAEKNASDWYLRVRGSSSKYIMIYKDRLDPLLSYQKTLHDIIKHCGKTPEIIIRSISELHRIEITLHNLMKELPGGIEVNKVEEKAFSFHERAQRGSIVPPIGNESDEELGKYYKNLHRQYENNQSIK